MAGAYSKIFLLFICFLPATCLADSFPFLHNEKLTFHLRWGFIPAGEVTLEIADAEGPEGQPNRHFILKARTNKAIDLLYTFRERIDAYMDWQMSHSLLYKKVQSGTRKRDVTVRFDWQNKTVQYANFGKATRPIPLQPGAVDPLSALYVLRAMDINADKQLERPVTDGKKLVTGIARFIKREFITVNGKRYDTFQLEPDMSDVKGVFEKSKNAKMNIWVTADDRKMLVKLQSKVIVGSFTAELVEHNYEESLRDKAHP